MADADRRVDWPLPEVMASSVPGRAGAVIRVFTYSSTIARVSPASRTHTRARRAGRGARARARGRRRVVAIERRAGDRQVAAARRAGRGGAARLTRARRRGLRVRGGPAVRGLGRGARPALARARRAAARAGSASGTSRACRARRAGAADRHQLHRALRELLEQLAAPRPLVLWLDDLHWAERASVDAVAALVRRPPGGAGAARTRRARGPAAGCADRRARRRGPRRPRDRPAAGAAAARPRRASSSAETCRDLRAQRRQPVLPRAARAGGRRESAPPRLRWPLSAELGGLGGRTPGGCWRRRRWWATRSTRRWRPRSRSCRRRPRSSALDELLRARSCDRRGAARRFAFRHPVVRHSVYDGAPGGWRLAAHERAAAALERRGAGVVARAHHIEHAAQLGDDRRARAARARRRARCRRRRPPRRRASTPPRCGILPDGPEHHERRQQIRVALAEAQSAAGDRAGGARDALGALADARDRQERHALAVRVANTEMWLGAKRSRRAGGCTSRSSDLPAEPSPDRIRLHLALGLLEHLACDVRRRARAGERRAVRRARARGSGARGGGADARRDRRPWPPARTARHARGVGRVRAAHRRAGDARAFPACGCSPGPTARSAASATRSTSSSAARRLAVATGREPVLMLVAIESVRPLRELGRLRRGGRGGRGGARPRAAGRQPAAAAVGAVRARRAPAWRPAT